MSWNNATPAWMHNPEFDKATKQYHDGEIEKEEVYERIKDIEEVPDNIKENWRPE